MKSLNIIKFNFLITLKLILFLVIKTSLPVYSIEQLDSIKAYSAVSTLIARQLLTDSLYLPTDTGESSTVAFITPSYYKLDDPTGIEIDLLASLELSGYGIAAGISHTFGYGLSLSAAMSTVTIDGTLISQSRKSKGSAKTFYSSGMGTISLGGLTDQIFSDFFKTSTNTSYILPNFCYGYIYALSRLDYTTEADWVWGESRYTIISIDKLIEHKGWMILCYWEIGFNIKKLRFKVLPYLSMTQLSSEKNIVKDDRGTEYKINYSSYSSTFGTKVQIDTGKRISLTFSIDGFFNTIEVEVPIYNKIKKIAENMGEYANLKSIVLGISYKL